MLFKVIYKETGESCMVESHSFYGAIEACYSNVFIERRFNGSGNIAVIAYDKYGGETATSWMVTPYGAVDIVT